MKLNISKCQVSPANRIYIVDALGNDELQTGRSKYDAILDSIRAEIPEQADRLKEEVIHRKCRDAESIKSLFSSIKDECNSSTFPLIFFDGHGDKKQGLRLLSSEYIDWKSFNQYLEDITYAAHGNLTVVASFCNSMSALERPSFGKPLPCPFYYGYSDEVIAGVVRDESQLIIESLIKSGKVDLTDKNIELYSEYDHVISLISVLLAKFLQPQKYADNYPDLSKNKLREIIRDDIGAAFGKTAKLNQIVTKAFDISHVIPEIVENSMHDTERKDLLLKEVQPLLERLKLENK